MAQNRTASLTVTMIDELSRPARTIEAALAQSEARIKELSAAMGEAGGSDRLLQSLNKLGATKSDVESVARSFVDYTRSAGLAADASEWTKTQAADVRAWERATVDSVRAVIRERNQETVAMRRAAAEQAEIQQRQVEATRRHAEESREATAHLARGVAGGIGGGIVGAIVGGEVLEAIKRSAEAGATVDQRIAQLKNTGTVSDADIDNTRARFREFSKTHAGVSEADWLAARKDAATMAPDDQGSFTELSARYRSALRNSGLPVGEHDVTNANRIMDEMALKTEPQREQFMNQLVQMQQRFGDSVPIGTYLSAIQNAKQAKFGWSPEFVQRYLPTLLQSAGEQGGTEIMTALSNYVGGHMTHAELTNLADLGFVNDKDLIRTKTGEIKGVRNGAKMFEAEKFESNPYEWAQDFHKTYMARPGSTEESFKELVAKFPRNMGALISDFVEAQRRYERDAAAADKPPGLKNADNAALAKNPATAADALKTSFEQLAASIAGPAVQSLAPSMAAAAQQVQTLAADIGALNPNIVALAGGAATLAAGYAGLKALFGGGSMFGGFGLKGSALALDESAAALTRAAVVMGGGQVSTGAGAAASVGGIARAGLGAAAAITGAVLAGSEAGNKEVFADPSVIARLKADDARKQANFDRDGFWKGSWENMFGAPGVEIRRPAAPGRDVHSPSSGPYSYTPAVNTSQIDGAQAKVDALGHSNPTVSLSLDTSAFDAAINRARAAINSLGALIPGTGMGASYGSHARGNFTASGFISGE